MGFNCDNKLKGTNNILHQCITVGRKGTFFSIHFFKPLTIEVDFDALFILNCINYEIKFSLVQNLRNGEREENVSLFWKKQLKMTKYNIF